CGRLRFGERARWPCGLAVPDQQHRGAGDVRRHVPEPVLHAGRAPVLSRDGADVVRRHGRGDTKRRGRVHGRGGERVRPRRRHLDARDGRRRRCRGEWPHLQGRRDGGVHREGSPDQGRQRFRRAGHLQRPAHRRAGQAGRSRGACLRRSVTLPNALTSVRAVLVIPVIGLIAIGDFSAALLVFLAAAATDAVDGPWARRLGGPTALGAALDPLADKVLVVGTLVALALRGIAPAWAVVLILARELVAVELRARSPQILGAGPDGKAKTVLQVAASLALLASAAWPSAGLTPAAGALVVGAAALTLLSGVRLVLRARQTTAHPA